MTGHMNVVVSTCLLSTLYTLPLFMEPLRILWGAALVSSPAMYGVLLFIEPTSPITAAAPQSTWALLSLRVC